MINVRRGWRDILRAEKALEKRIRRFVRRAGFSSRAELVRHLKRKDIARANRERYATRKAAGLCVGCGDSALEGQVHCRECARLNAEASKEARKKSKLGDHNELP
jgi:Arc/MetJ-type ribon-helix-helix transcriptional regulator